MLELPITYSDLQEILSLELERVSHFLEKQNGNFFPPKELIFASLELTSFKDVKVVILGQDPYHDDNQACGIAFSVPNNCKLPPSLKNIFKELNSDLSIANNSGNLQTWAEQGVLLINSVLTVEPHKPMSHRNQGWEEFTDKLITLLSEKKEHLVFVLWGNSAQEKSVLIDESKHKIIKSAHPSPLSASRGFFGSRPFSQINKALEMFNLAPINWEIKNKEELF